jgi:Glycosyl hydrolase family 31 C-terminal domain/Glycosyl hydrolases family 31 TIM-barrel domain
MAVSPEEHHPAHPPLLDPSDARANVGGYDDYPEVYTRWFEYATFLPIFRAHGSRPANEVWSYGKQAEPILERNLRLRYQLMPYIDSLGYNTWLTGAPFMRALPLDFPNDPQVADLRDEYMFGLAFLVAPETEQGATSRQVYLPADADWYNYWRNEPPGRAKHKRSRAHSHHSALRTCRVDRAVGRTGGEHASNPSCLQDSRVSRGGCQLHAVLRRRQNLCLRKGRGLHYALTLGRRDRQIYS